MESFDKILAGEETTSGAVSGETEGAEAVFNITLYA